MPKEGFSLASQHTARLQDSQSGLIQSRILEVSTLLSFCCRVDSGWNLNTQIQDCLVTPVSVVANLMATARVHGYSAAVFSGTLVHSQIRLITN